jgi:hypothetical protein
MWCNPYLAVVFIPRLGPDDVQRFTTFRVLVISQYKKACYKSSRQELIQDTLTYI